MKKNYLVIVGGLLSCISHAQLGINTIPHESTIFDMSKSSKGFLLSKMELKTPQASEPVKEVKDGLIVYNSTKNNSLYETYYVWNNNKWEPVFNEQRAVAEFTSTGIHASALGYNPNGEGNSAPDEFAFENVTAKKVKPCVKYTDTYKDAIEHTYCAYKLSDNIDWSQAFNLAKSLKGYLTVITTNNEWNFINDNIIKAKGKELNNAIWLGYTKIATPGNAAKYNWITNEKSVYNWGLESNVQASFIANQPENASLNTISKCTYILPTATNTDRKWSSSDCTTTTNHKNFIIEFSK